MKLVLKILFIVIALTMAFGFYVKNDPNYNGEVIIGLSVLALSFLFMPLFIYYRWKDKKMEDYMLNEDNIRKMREREGDERKI